MIRFVAAALAVSAITTGATASELPHKADGAVRIATFNASLNRRNPGELVQ